MFDLQLFIKKERIEQIIDRENSIKQSFIELLKGSAISFALLFLSFVLNRWYGPKSNDPLDTYLNGMLQLYLLFANIFAWVYSLMLAVVLRWVILNKNNLRVRVGYKPHHSFTDLLIARNESLNNVTSTQSKPIVDTTPHDTLADLLCVINELQKNILIVSSFFYTVIMATVAFGEGFDIFTTSNALTAIGIIALVFFPLIMFGSWALQLLSIRMQAFAVEKIYKIPWLNAVGLVIAANMMVGMITQFVTSFIFIVFQFAIVFLYKF